MYRKGERVRSRRSQGRQESRERTGRYAAREERDEVEIKVNLWR